MCESQGRARAGSGDPPEDKTGDGMRIGTSSYSFRRLPPATPEERETTLEQMIPLAARHNLAGMELLAVQFASEEPAYLHNLKRLAVENGLDLYGLSLHNNFVTPDPAKRAEQIAYVKRWIDHAVILGVPVVRVFGGRWGTIKDFFALMDAEGVEQPLPGYRAQDALDWNAECFKACCEHAARSGVILALENHWGLTYSAEQTLAIMGAVGEGALAVALDCGNFRLDTYRQLELLAPHAVMVHAKTYVGGGIFYTLAIDYPRIIALLRNVGFNGYLSIEAEGKAPPSEGLPASIALLEGALASA